jgi:uncharacterized membrane protein YuzA (DUF378 family)
MKKLDVIAAALVIIGALNWGFAGMLHLDLVAAVFGMRFGETSLLSSLVYGLVGLSGLYQALTWKSIQRRWYPDAWTGLIPLRTRRRASLLPTP